MLWMFRSESTICGKDGIMAGLAERIDWDKMEREVDARIRRLQQRPEGEKPGVRVDPASILKAYVRGYIPLAKALTMFRVWKRMP